MCTYNDGSVQYHGRNASFISRPKRADQLAELLSVSMRIALILIYTTYCTTERVRKRRYSRRSDPPIISKPQAAIPGRRREHKRLRQANYDLPKHDDAEMAARGPSSGIPDPVAHQDKDAGCDDGGFRAAFVEGPYDYAGAC